MNEIGREAELLSKLFDQRALMSQRAFGDQHRLGSASMVWQYLHGRRALSLKAGCRFARGLGVNLSQFSPRLAIELQEVLEASNLLVSTESTQQDYVRIPCVELKVRAGDKGFSTKPLLPTTSFIAFRYDWLASHNYMSEKLLAIECNDDGMQPTISKGDLVVINIADSGLVDGQVYAVNYEGHQRIRRMFRDAGSWWLQCDNPDSQRFPRKQLIMKHCFLLGRVVHRQSENI